MNQPQYLESHQPHMSAAQSYAPSTPSSMPHYPHYQQQPSVLQPGPASYTPSPSAYGQYGYPNGVTSPQSAGQPVSSSMGQQMNSGLLPLPAMPASGNQQHTYISGPGGPAPGYPQQNYDTTGQVAPPGMKPRVTATLWEDEGSMCFQVEAKGVCVARRDDNHMINGTKLLNVAGMTRGRRDGILKSEKLRHVVKIGPMHLKGVWIPFERALDFANKEKITELLYPLFVHNIGALLYHPTNSNRTNAVMAAAERRKLETKQQQQQGGILGPPGSQPPSLHHHHSMTNPVASHVSQSPHSIAPHPGSRPNLDRAHTFPTPPTSASSTVGMNSQGQYDSWGQNMGAGVQSTQPLAIDTHAHSTPNTPATTPPGPPMSMQSYPGQQPYDSSRPMYSSATTQQAQYATPPQQTVPQQSMARLGGPIQTTTYLKHEMGPPSRAPGSGPDIEHGDHKSEGYTHSQGNEAVGHGTGEEEAEHEHDSEYPHENNAAYNANRGTYSNYGSAPNLGSMPGEHSHLSPEMSGSPPHQNGSGRVTPRTAAGSQQWTAGYHTPPRASASSNQYPSINDARATVTNGTSGTETYPQGSLPASYAPLHVNGTTPSNKRMREDDDQDHQSRPASRGDDIESLKRRKMAREGSVSGPIVGANNFEREPRPINRTRAPIPQQQQPPPPQQQQRRGR